MYALIHMGSCHNAGCQPSQSRNPNVMLQQSPESEYI